MLPDFTERNWFSDVRTIAGFGPVQPGAPSDFIYEDTQGIITTMLFGPDRAAQWRDAQGFPTYLLEVKSTSNQEVQRFHLSPYQLNWVSVSRGLVLAKIAIYVLTYLFVDGSNLTGSAPTRRGPAIRLRHHLLSQRTLTTTTVTPRRLVLVRGSLGVVHQTELQICAKRRD